MPVPIYPEEDVCEFCRMLITDQRFAAECLMKKGRAKKFDDPICMIRYFTEGKVLGVKKEDIRACFVKDYHTQEWVRAERAYYVKAQVFTVMGYGIVAFKDQTSAEKFAQTYKGQLLSYQDLWQLYQKPDRKIYLTLANGTLSPSVVEVRFNELLEFYLETKDPGKHRLKIMGYGTQGVFPEVSPGHPALLRLRADRPGTGFAFVEEPSGKILGFFKVKGAHFKEEMKRR